MCEKMKDDIHIYNGEKEVPKYAKHVRVADNVTMIKDYAFYECYDLETLDLNDSLLQIGRGAFEGCVSLEELIIPTTVEEIEDWAFFECERLRRVEFNENLQSIGDGAFCNCKRLKGQVPAASVQIGEHAFSKTSLGWCNLLQIWWRRKFNSS